MVAWPSVARSFAATCLILTHTGLAANDDGVVPALGGNRLMNHAEARSPGECWPMLGRCGTWPTQAAQVHADHQLAIVAGLATHVLESKSPFARLT